MGLTDKQLGERAKDENVLYIKNLLCDKDGDKDYVFISYKSDDWKIVLKDVVYRLVKDYGLHVYFDGSFDEHNSHWIDQFPENMEDVKCKGVLAFLDDKYRTSYATLLELMYSQCGCRDGDCKIVRRKVIPIYLEKLNKIEDESDTYLGKEYLGDNTVNPYADKERELFCEIFKDKIGEKVFENTKRKVRNEFINKIEKNETDAKLTKHMCSLMIGELLAYNSANDKYYNSENKSLDGIVESIRDACGESVFDQSALYWKKKQESGGTFRSSDTSSDAVLSVDKKKNKKISGDAAPEKQSDKTDFPRWPFDYGTKEQIKNAGAYTQYWRGLYGYLKTRDKLFEPYLKFDPLENEEKGFPNNYEFYHIGLQKYGYKQGKGYLECDIAKTSLKILFYMKECHKFSERVEEYGRVKKCVEGLLKDKGANFGEFCCSPEDSNSMTVGIRVDLQNENGPKTVGEQYEWFRKIIPAFYDAIKDCLS